MPETAQKLLILDIDETLVYSSEKKLDREPDFTVGRYFVYRRPYLREFLNFCFENFQVAVWTTGTRSYAEKILENIFDAEDEPVFLWTLERCTWSYDPEEHENYYEKKMTKVRRRGFSLDAVIVIDDTPRMWRSSYGNLVPVKSYLGETEDDELKLLIKYLGRLKTVRDVRNQEKRNWRNNL